MHIPPLQTELIALDWGTSSLRAYRMGADGQVLEVRPLPWGIMHLPDSQPDGRHAAGFERAFDQACGDWLQAEPDVPVIAAGMVGSRQGWQEAPYLPLPVTISDIGQTLAQVRTQAGKLVHIVPGLIQHGSLPNVMRGEETQVIGAIRLLEDTPVDEIVIGLPGTHSKWLRIKPRGKASCIEQFHTFMTGEVYAALCEHTILGCSMNHTGLDDTGALAAFDRGARVATCPEGRAGLLSTIFSTRTLGLTAVLNGAAQHEYLSGLLIGYEINALQQLLDQADFVDASIMLIGSTELCTRYTRVLRAYGASNIQTIARATEQGLWQLARTAGLLPASNPQRSTHA
jgi:2-dehydro-3-deoxygalactonokinase